MLIFNLIFIFLLGLIIGSFLSALSYRLPKNISIAKGRSFCPKCKKKIEWFDNIPLFSFIFLRGRCRNCRKHISFRYPLIEFFTAAGFLFIGYYFYANPLFMIYFLITYSLLVLIFVIDLEHQFIPDTLVFSGIFITFIWYLLSSSPDIFTRIFAGFISATFLLLINIFTGGKGMGLGDVKFAVFAGMTIGLNLIFPWLFASFLTGGIVGIILILTGSAKLRDKIAFGPFLVLGFLMAQFLGNIFLKFIGF